MCFLPSRCGKEIKLQDILQVKDSSALRQNLCWPLSHYPFGPAPFTCAATITNKKLARANTVLILLNIFHRASISRQFSGGVPASHIRINRLTGTLPNRVTRMEINAAMA